MSIGPPIFDFSSLHCCTMTVIVAYNVGELNLPGLFTFLPVTDLTLPAHLNFQKKQGKIKLPPELNKKGEILSMRYNKQVRGIVRSEIPSSFSHSIIIDVGTSERIVSVKLSRKLELTGPTSFKIAREAVETVLGHVKKCQENQIFLQMNHDLAIQMKYKFLHAISGGEVEPQKFNENEIKIWEIYRQQTKGYAIDKIEDFLDFMLNFNRNLYTGTLEITEIDSEMANILFNLGYSINQIAFAKIMNQEPFECKFTNAKSASAVNVFYHYSKIDRNTGQLKAARHTIRVNKSGHVRHSGPNIEAMKPVYYAFIQRVLQYYSEIQSIENCKQQLRVIGTPKSYSIAEWKEFILKENELKRRILNSEVPIAISLNIKRPEIVIYTGQSRVDSKLETLESDVSRQFFKNTNCPSLMFDYSPLLSTI
jgi:hypothetical protein